MYTMFAVRARNGKLSLTLNRTAAGAQRQATPIMTGNQDLVLTRARREWSCR
jgi:hypothetical protein